MSQVQAEESWEYSYLESANWNLVHTLAGLRRGALNARDFERIEGSKRAASLQLNVSREVESRHKSGVNSMDIDTSENRYLLSGGADGALAIHDLRNTKDGQDSNQYTKTCPVIHYQKKADQRRNSMGHSFSVETVQWYPPDSGMFTSASFDKRVLVWDANTMKAVDRIRMPENVYSHHMSPIATAHSLIAVGLNAATVFLADLRTGSKSHILKAHVGKVISVQWSNSEEFQLASGGSDGRVHVWDVRSAKSVLKSFDQHNSKRKDGHVGHKARAHAGQVISLLFIGYHLASLANDYSLRLWHLPSGLNSNVNFGRVKNNTERNLQMAASKCTAETFLFVPNGPNISRFNVKTSLLAGGQPGSDPNLIGHFGDVNCVLYDDVQHELYSGAKDRAIINWSGASPAPDACTTGQANNSTIEDSWSDDDGD